jgi:hypothetical protein
MNYKKCIHCNKKKLHTEEFFYRVIEKKRRNYRKECTYLMGTCKKCWSINAKKSRKKHKKSIIKLRFKYNNSERGYFIGMFNNIKQSHKRKKQKNEFKNYEEFYQCWLDQQKIYGRLCPYTKIEMTMIRHTGNKKTIPTNISRERILSTRGYSKKNLMFVSWGINNSKGNITPKTAKRYLEIVKERYGTDEVE